MKILSTINELNNTLLPFREKNLSVGFVPTMGALHNGHIELIKQSVKENLVTVASIFVNPTQFNNPIDLENYPRTEKEDIILLNKNKCDFIFIPTVDGMYPEKELLDINFGLMETVMEGAFRPGHFKGVATVVKKLFDIVQPHVAYFGKKDFQQLAIIRNMVSQLNLKIKIVGCETVREKDGLAMSSRNIHLTASERENASVIYQSLLSAKKEYAAELVLEKIKNHVKEKIEESGLFKVEYFEIVNATTLQPLESVFKNILVQSCIAVLTSKTRLIDNIELYRPPNIEFS